LNLNSSFLSLFYFFAMETTLRFHEDAIAGKGKWFIEQDGESLAELRFRVTDEGNFALESTRVDDRLRGAGAGKRLVNAAAEVARARGVRLLAVCPFVVALFEKSPDYDDVKISA
jgi:predicted GNAT family acetyltransferase